jgi:hypothetical protein
VFDHVPSENCHDARALAVDARHGVARRGSFCAPCGSVDGKDAGVGTALSEVGWRAWSVGPGGKPGSALASTPWRAKVLASIGRS